MNTALPEDITEFAAVAAKRLARFGGPQAALRAETNYVNAIYDYHKALATLEAAVGRPLR